MIGDPHMNQVLELLGQAASRRSWLVAVCRDDASAQLLRKVMASAIPYQATFSGRTAVLPDGGHVSVVSLDDETFNTEKPYQVVFLGCSKDPRATLWRGSHQEVVL